MSPLHCLYSRSDFGFEFSEIFVIEKRLPDSPSRRLFDSASRGVAKSLTQRVRESTTLQLANAGNFLLNIQWPIWRVRNPPTRRVGDSRNLPSGRVADSPSQRVTNCPTRRVGKSFFDYKYLREFEAMIGTARNVL